MDGGDGRTTMPMRLMPLNHMLKNGYNGEFWFVYFTTIKKWNNEAAREKHGQMFLCRKTFREDYGWKSFLFFYAEKPSEKIMGEKAFY